MLEGYFRENLGLILRAISAETFREIFRPYAWRMFGRIHEVYPGGIVEKFLKELLERILGKSLGGFAARICAVTSGEIPGG